MHEQFFLNTIFKYFSGGMFILKHSLQFFLISEYLLFSILPKSAHESRLFNLKKKQITSNKTQVMNKICHNCSNLLYFMDIDILITDRETG